MPKNGSGLYPTCVRVSTSTTTLVFSQSSTTDGTGAWSDFSTWSIPSTIVVAQALYVPAVGVYVMCTSSAGGGRCTIYWTSSLPLGSNVSPSSVTLEPSFDTQGYGDTMIYSGGNIIVTKYLGTSNSVGTSGDHVISVYSSTDMTLLADTTVMSINRLSHADGFLISMVASPTVIHAAYTDGTDVYYRTSTDNTGVTWNGQQTVITGQTNLRHVAILRTSAWMAIFFTAQVFGSVLYYILSTDNGISWGGRVAVSTNPALGGFPVSIINGYTHGVVAACGTNQQPNGKDFRFDHIG